MSASITKAGFINILGKPNVGKSTLMNALLGERLSIVTSKAQTTRQRIFGILTEQNYQMVFSDTPGFLVPKYELHHAMMSYIKTSLEDADILVLLVDVRQSAMEDQWLDLLKKSDAPTLIVLNKIDLCTQAEIAQQTEEWQRCMPSNCGIIAVSASKKIHIDALKQKLIELLPQHPAYFPEDQLTQHTERFFAAEIIREKIFLFYEDEVPYSCEVVVDGFKEKEQILVILATVFVERNSQKAILIGKDGRMLKKLGIAARVELEKFFGRKVFLETFIKVDEDWRQNKLKLKKFGYLP